MGFKKKKKKYEYCVIKSAVTGKHSVMLQTKTNQPVKSLSFWSSCCLTARFDSAPHACSPLICLIYTLLPCYAHLSFSMRQPIWMCGIMIVIIHIHQRPQSWCHHIQKESWSGRKSHLFVLAQLFKGTYSCNYIVDNAADLWQMF